MADTDKKPKDMMDEIKMELEDVRYWNSKFKDIFDSTPDSMPFKYERHVSFLLQEIDKLRFDLSFRLNEINYCECKVPMIIYDKNGSMCSSCYKTPRRLFGADLCVCSNNDNVAVGKDGVAICGRCRKNLR